jgi:hypothetical protein
MRRLAGPIIAAAVVALIGTLTASRLDRSVWPLLLPGMAALGGLIGAAIGVHVDGNRRPAGQQSPAKVPPPVLGLGSPPPPKFSVHQRINDLPDDAPTATVTAPPPADLDRTFDRLDEAIDQWRGGTRW